MDILTELLYTALGLMVVCAFGVIILSLRALYKEAR